MSTDPVLARFEAKAQAWDEYTATPLGRLRQELTLRQLTQHLETSPGRLRVLDAGAGTGDYALFLAQRGHRVWLLDFSAQMLSIARRKAGRLGPSVLEQVEFCRTPVEETPTLFSADHFDLILCHTLLEYVQEPGRVLQALSAVLRPGGLLSLLVVNADADALRWALVGQDLEKARLALRDRISQADLFDLPRRIVSVDVVREALAQAGAEIQAEHGVRIFADYLPAEKLRDPEFFANLVELELAAGKLDPYRLIARYVHVLARKQVAERQPASSARKPET